MGKVPYTEIGTMPAGSLEVDQNQNHAWSGQDAQEANPDLLNIKLVSKRDGNYYLVDNVHRLYAMKNLIKDRHPVTCGNQHGPF